VYCRDASFSSPVVLYKPRSSPISRSLSAPAQTRTSSGDSVIQPNMVNVLLKGLRGTPPWGGLQSDLRVASAVPVRVGFMAEVSSPLEGVEEISRKAEELSLNSSHRDSAFAPGTQCTQASTANSSRKLSRRISSMISGRGPLEPSLCYSVLGLVNTNWNVVDQIVGMVHGGKFTDKGLFAGSFSVSSIGLYGYR
jgi:hypothetical protein